MALKKCMMTPQNVQILSFNLAKYRNSTQLSNCAGTKRKSGKESCCRMGHTEVKPHIYFRE